MQTNSKLPRVRARAATVQTLLAPDGVVALILDPLPTPRQFIRWLNQANVPRIKPNPSAKRGGGVSYYLTSHVEKMLKARLGNIAE